MLKAVVDRSVMIYDKLEIKVDPRTFSVKISLESVSKHHRQLVLKPCKTGFRAANLKQNWKGAIQAKPLHEGVVSAVMKVLKHPRVSVDKLIFDFSIDSSTKKTMSKFNLETFKLLKMSILDSLRAQLEQQRSRKLSVGSLTMKLWDGCEADVLCILPSLKPGALCSIHLDFEGIDKSCSLDRVISTDQWKKARKLIAEGFFLDSTPFKAWRHFSCLMGSLKKLDISLFETMAKVINRLSLLSILISSF